MTKTIQEALLEGRCVAVSDSGSTEVGMNVWARYTAARPLEVELTFGTATTNGCGVRWVVGRDLLVEGLTRSAGILDIVLNTYSMRDGDITIITLQPPGAEPAHIAVSTFALSEFLAVTEDLVPPGTESVILLAEPIGTPTWDVYTGDPDSGEQLNGADG